MVRDQHDVGDRPGDEEELARGGPRTIRSSGQRRDQRHAEQAESDRREDQGAIRLLPGAERVDGAARGRRSAESQTPTLIEASRASNS